MDQRAFVTDDGVLWTFPRNTGSLIQCSLDGFDRDTLSVHPTVSSSDFHAKPIDNVFYSEWHSLFCGCRAGSLCI